MFSLLLPCRDHHSYTRLTLRRLIDCTESAFELFIADDSERPVEHEIGDLLNELEKMNFHYTILRPEERRISLAQLRNEVFRIAKCEVLINVDNDVIVTPKWDTPVLQALKEHEDFGLVMPMCNDLYFFETNIDLLSYCNKFKSLRNASTPDFVMGGPNELWSVIEKTFDESLDEFAKSYPKMRGQLDKKFIDFRNNWACWAIKMECMKDVGGYDERYLKCGYEDLDLAWRFNLCGYRTVVCMDVFVFHCMGTTRPFIEGAVEAETKNMEYYQKKWSNPNLNPRENWI